VSSPILCATCGSMPSGSVLFEKKMRVLSLLVWKAQLAYELRFGKPNLRDDEQILSPMPPRLGMMAAAVNLR